MDIKQIRSEFKKLVIMGCHPECETYEEALKKELGFGCIVKFGEKYEYWGKFINFKSKGMGQDTVVVQTVLGNQQTLNYEWIKIIGLPITIARVIQAILNSLKESVAVNMYGEIIDVDGDDGNKVVCSWQLTRDGRECTDDEQSDETIISLLALLK